MDKSEIISFSLESLKNMHVFIEPEDHTYRGCFFAYRNIYQDDKLNMFRYPCRLNAYIAIMFTEGRAEIILNMRHYTINKCTLFVSMPNDIIQLDTLKDCEFYIIAFNDDFVRRVNIDYKMVLSVFLGIQKRPCIQISQEETNSLSETFHNLSYDMNLFNNSKYSDEIVMTYISLSAYKACSIVSKYQGSTPADNTSVSRYNEEYFNKFLELLNQNFNREHNIEFYASQICITPKYLSSLIKKISGKSASQWINDYIIMEAKHLLKYSDMSIQKISDYLSFPNQSFFSQYFKRYTGVTPSKYKSQL